MARSRLNDTPSILNCSSCAKEIILQRHHRSRWRKGQRLFYCCNKCHSSSLIGKPNPVFSKLLKGNKYRVGKAPSNKLYNVTENYFEHINNPEKAYWLGYIAADGCVHEKEHNYFIFSIISIDLDQLEKLKTALNFTGNIVKRNVNGFIRYSITINNTTFSKFLISHGIVPRKTFKLIYPYFLSKELIPHYIRGYLDGDGSITTKEQRIQFNIVGTFALISGVASYLEDNNILKSNSIHKDGNIFKLQRSQKQALNFLNYIYKDSSLNTRMNRKYNKYINYMESQLCK